MDLGLTDRVALVAAGSSGLGLAVATALAAEGAVVSVCGRDPDRGLDAAALREAVELTLASAVTMVNAALPHLRAGGWGRVLLIASQSAKQPIPGLALSNTLRPAVAGYAKTLVGELAGSGVTVNVLAPGMTRTAALEEWAAELPDGLAGLAADIPLGRVAEPAEFGAVAAFLASEQAAFVTGIVLPVDGGATRGLL